MATKKGNKVKVTLVKSGIGRGQKQNATLEALGLKKLHASKEFVDCPQIRGMIKRVEHLLEVQEI